jgi:hypothetical protein
LDDYLNNFDIVFTNDGNLIHVVELIRFLAGAHPMKKYCEFKNSDIVNSLQEHEN